MKLTELYPSRYLAVTDLDGQDYPVVMASVRIEKIKNNEGEEDEKPVLYFRGVQKGLVLNKTNAQRIAEEHGDETDLWVGKRITLTPEMVASFGKSTWAIRVKPLPPKGKNYPAKIATVPSEPTDDPNKPEDPDWSVPHDEVPS